MLSFAMTGAEWVLWLLVGLSVLCLAVALERIWYFRRSATPVSTLHSSVDAYLGGGEVAAFQASLKDMGGFEARVISAGLNASVDQPSAAEKAMSGTARAEKLAMERGLSVLATVGSNAPFIGLLGTVLGIMQAFADLAENSDDAKTAVMAGISEALVATAVGLLVAIPAVVLYNAFSRAVKARLGRAESLADLVLARLEA